MPNEPIGLAVAVTLWATVIAMALNLCARWLTPMRVALIKTMDVAVALGLQVSGVTLVAAATTTPGPVPFIVGTPGALFFAAGVAGMRRLSRRATEGK